MNESSGCHLAFDLGYVFIRNYAINRLASQGVYLFDYRSILEELQGRQRFSDLCLNRLIDLRKGKHAYRAGVSHVAKKSLGHEVASSISEACLELNLEAVSSSTGVRRFSPPYATLRDCEAALLSKESFRSSARINKKRLDQVQRLIRKPREYSWQVRSIDERWIASANKLIWSDMNNKTADASERASHYGIGVKSMHCPTN